MPIKKAEKEIGSSPIKPPTDAELGVGDDWLDQYDYDNDYDDVDYEDTGAYVQPIHPLMAKDLSENEPNMWTEIIDKNGQVIGLETSKAKAKVAMAKLLNKQQTLADKKKIAEEYLAAEAAKKKKVGGNPLLIVKVPEGSGLLQKATSVKGSSHDKTGPYGGSSSYTDADVGQARAYMQSVLGIDSMSVNGRALEHILAEVYGFSKRDSEKEILALKAKIKNIDGLEMQITQLKKTLGKATEALEQSQKDLAEAEKFAKVGKQMDKETVAKTSTGRRIKE